MRPPRLRLVIAGLLLALACRPRPPAVPEAARPGPVAVSAAAAALAGNCPGVTSAAGAPAPPSAALLPSRLRAISRASTLHADVVVAADGVADVVVASRSANFCERVQHGERMATLLAKGTVALVPRAPAAHGRHPDGALLDALAGGPLPSPALFVEVVDGRPASTRAAVAGWRDDAIDLVPVGGDEVAAATALPCPGLGIAARQWARELRPGAAGKGP